MRKAEQDRLVARRLRIGHCAIPLRLDFIIAGRLSDLSASPKFREPFHERVKEPGRQEPVVVTGRLPGNLPQVIARPSEDVDLVEHDPG